MFLLWFKITQVYCIIVNAYVEENTIKTFPYSFPCLWDISPLSVHVLFSTTSLHTPFCIPTLLGTQCLCPCHNSRRSRDHVLWIGYILVGFFWRGCRGCHLSSNILIWGKKRRQGIASTDSGKELAWDLPRPLLPEYVEPKERDPCGKHQLSSSEVVCDSLD